jgi:DNA-binding response OmpR family regulator
MADVQPSRPELPPIVLLVDEHLERLEMYSRCLELAGLWVTTTRVSSEAVAAAEEIKPDIIVADTDGHPGETAQAIIALKHHAALGCVPIIALTSGDGDGTAADAVLVKPVDPSLLLRRTRELLARSAQVRATADEARQRAAVARNKAALALERSTRFATAAAAQTRRCPACGGTLEWIEQAAIGEVIYDYYRWCLAGCGLYCFDRDHAKWVKLG